jgi:hypothetical protein
MSVISQLLILFRCGSGDLGGSIIVAKNGSEKRLDNVTETGVQNEQNHESQHKKPEQADENLEYLENKPQHYQACQENEKWVFKQIVHAAFRILGY